VTTPDREFLRASSNQSAGWVVVGITVVAALLVFGIRSAPSVLIKPLEADFGWSRAEISSAIAIGLVLTGLAVPFGGALMDRVGPTRVLIGCLVLTGASVLGAATMHHLWQMNLFLGRPSTVSAPGPPPSSAPRSPTVGLSSVAVSFRD
jgi:MFS family permease